MEQGHLRVMVVEWEEASAEGGEAGAGWEGRNLGLDQRGTAFAPIAAQWLPTRWGHLAIA